MVRHISDRKSFLPSPASQNRSQNTKRIFLHTNPRVLIQRGVSQEKYQKANLRNVHSASKRLLPVLPFRRIGLPSSSPFMGTTVILYSVPGCRPANKQPGLGEVVLQTLAPNPALPQDFPHAGSGGLCFSPEDQSKSGKAWQSQRNTRRHQGAYRGVEGQSG